MDNKETGLETCWRTWPSQPSGNLWRHKNGILIGRPLFIPWSQCKSNCAKVFAFSLQKPMPPYALDICLLLTSYKSDVERFSWRHLAMAGAYTFTITKCLSNPRPARIFKVFKYWCFVIAFFFLAKWHRVLGIRQSDVRDINRGSLPFSSWSFNFSFRRSLLAQHIQLKFTRTESRSTDVFKFCQYAFVIYSKLCVDPSTHKASI